MGTIIGIMFLISGIPQTIKLLRTKDSRGVSVLTYAITVTAIWLSVFVAVQQEAWELVKSNGISALMTSLNLYLVILYRYDRVT